MIKVNLIGAGRKKAVEARSQDFAAGQLHARGSDPDRARNCWRRVLVVLESDAANLQALDRQIQRWPRTRKPSSMPLSKQDQIYEARKKVLENRVKSH